MVKSFIKELNNCSLLTKQEKELIKREYLEKNNKKIKIIKKNKRRNRFYKNLEKNNKINYFFDVDFEKREDKNEYLMAVSKNKNISLLNLFEILTSKDINFGVYENIFKNSKYLELAEEIKFVNNYNADNIEVIITRKEIILIQIALFNENILLKQISEIMKKYPEMNRFFERMILLSRE